MGCVLDMDINSICCISCSVTEVGMCIQSTDLDFCVILAFSNIAFCKLGGFKGRGVSVLANASMALALSTHTPRVQLSVYTLSTCWHSELGYDTPGRYLASSGTPVNYYYYYSANWHACMQQSIL